MSDHIDRAAEVIDPVAFSTDWASAPDPRAAAEGGWLMDRARDIARALDAAGLLVTPEHDRAVAARALRDTADALPSLTEGEGREGIRTWRQTVQDAYSIAVEESQSALRARADRIEAGETDAHT